MGTEGPGQGGAPEAKPRTSATATALAIGSHSARAGGPGWAEAMVHASAWALVVLLPVHVVTNLLVSDPAQATAADLFARWDHPWWRLLDWLVIVLGLGHGALGSWRVLHAGPPSTSRTVIAVALGAICGLLVVGVTAAVATVGW